MPIGQAAGTTSIASDLYQVQRVTLGGGVEHHCLPSARFPRLREAREADRPGKEDCLSRDRMERKNKERTTIACPISPYQAS